MTLIERWIEDRYGRLLKDIEHPEFTRECEGAQSFYNFLYEQGYMIVRTEIKIHGTIYLERKEL